MTGFNVEKFTTAEFEPRTEQVQIPALAEFFEDGEPVFVVRGLSASELHKALEASSRQSQLGNVVKAIASSADQIQQIRSALGMGENTPGEIAKRIEMLTLGCVTPKITHAVSAKIAEWFPVEFYDITNKITTLTGQGGNRVKPQPSSQQTQV